MARLCGRQAEADPQLTLSTLPGTANSVNHGKILLENGVRSIQVILGKTQGIFTKKPQRIFTKTQVILRKTQGYANCKLEIVAEKCPKKA